MKTIKANSKRGKNYTKLYNNWGVCFDIFDAYDRPSDSKIRAFQECKRLCREGL